jgi:pilus assembly protein CpaC
VLSASAGAEEIAAAPATGAPAVARETAAAAPGPKRMAAPRGTAYQPRPAALQEASESTSEISVPVNKSRVISSPIPFSEISVANPEIADVVPLTSNRFYVLGKVVGSTNVTLTDAKANIIDIIDVTVGYDVQSLKRAIYEVAPEDEIQVRSTGNAVVLSGAVSSADRAGKIATLADGFAPGKVNNMLAVSGSQQVMLSVRFAEVQRSALKDMGVNIDATIFSGDDVINLVSGQGVNPLAFATGGFSLIGNNYALDALIDALEEKGMVRTLAEPNIIALSGDTASFLAGGEFPIPVAQGLSTTTSLISSAITVEFKEFGVGLSFTPTVVGQETINLELESEVSAIDPTASITTGNLTIPGLKVRRTRTTVELLDGQSFAISGLIQDDFESALRGIPWLGSVPILGTLFRSQNFQRKQTELVVIITARLVRPAMQAQLAAPTDLFLPPHEFDFFLFGRPETLAARGAAGVDGKYGYVMP